MRDESGDGGRWRHARVDQRLDEKQERLRVVETARQLESAHLGEVTEKDTHTHTHKRGGEFGGGARKNSASRRGSGWRRRRRRPRSHTSP